HDGSTIPKQYAFRVDGYGVTQGNLNTGKAG
ncbi:uncharacterized protein METZ01_LOCUS456443, partial [marine metagenome]